MNRLLLVLAVIVFALGAAACGSSSKKSSTSSPTTNPAATTAPAYGSAGSSTTAPTASGAVLQVAMNAKLHQNIVVDSAGKTVYIYVPDGASTTSKVPAALQAAWPEVTTTSNTPAVGPGLTASKVTVNAAHQVAYNGHLLYTFKADARAGVANGQGLGKIWYVISPTGTPIT